MSDAQSTGHTESPPDLKDREQALQNLFSREVVPHLRASLVDALAEEFMSHVQDLKLLGDDPAPPADRDARFRNWLQESIVSIDTRIRKVEDRCDKFSKWQEDASEYVRDGRVSRLEAFVRQLDGRLSELADEDVTSLDSLHAGLGAQNVARLGLQRRIEALERAMNTIRTALGYGEKGLEAPRSIAWRPLTTHVNCVGKTWTHIGEDPTGHLLLARLRESGVPIEVMRLARVHEPTES